MCGSANISVAAWPISRASLIARSASTSAARSQDPKDIRPKRQDRYPIVLPKSHCERTMLGRVVKCARLIVVGPTFRKISV